MEAKVIQRRRVPRRTFTRQVGILIRGQYLLCKAIQIGEGGMLLSCEHDLKIAQQVVLTLFIPGFTQAVIRATVRYSRPGDKPGDPHKYGVQFETVEFNVRRQIRNYVAAKSVEEAHEERTLQKQG